MRNSILSTSGATALVTGATSGIGAHFARRLATEGYHLILTGRRREKIQAVAAEIRENTGRSVDVIIIDLADRTSREQFCATLRERDDIAFVVNNAGFGYVRRFDADSASRFLDMLDVHVRATLEIIAATLPHMQNRQFGTIINVSSLASFFPVPKGSGYAATKAFLTSFSESLAMELRSENIRVQALCPGMTRTDFHDQMGIGGKELKQRKVFVWMTADNVVRKSFRALDRNRVVCIPGISNYLTVRVLSHLPRKLYYTIMRLARK